MTELVRLVLRGAGVLLPGAALLGVSEVTGGEREEDFGVYALAMLLSVAVCATWSAWDARRGPTLRVLARWAVVVLSLGSGLGVLTTVLAPGGPPSERVGEAIAMSLFYGVPLLVAGGLGLAIGNAERRSAR